MSIESAIVDCLEHHVGLSALVGARVYPLVLPQDAEVPAVVYQRVSAPRVHAIGGASFLASPRFQFTCWGATYASAKAVAEQVIAALDGVLGSIGEEDEAPQWFAQLDNDLDDYDEATGRYRVIVDVIVTHDDN